MPQEINQEQPINEFSKKDADIFAATLSFATRLSEQLLPKTPQSEEKGSTSDLEQKDDVDTAKEEKVDLEANNKEIEKMINSKLDGFKKELKATIKDEISGIKESIEEALNEDGE